MNRRSFIVSTALAAAGASGTRVAIAAAPRTFVLVHGAWHGGWCWDKVAPILRARGHKVATPTQTGLGERSHLLSKSITLDVFVDDMVNVVKWEELSDIVLVGHSFGGSAISGVADRTRDRVRQLIYLDALMLENGRSPFSMLPKEIVEARMKAAEDSSGGLSLPAPRAAAFGVTDPQQAAWVEARLTPHPLSTFTSPLKLGNKVGNGVPASYIVCTDPIYGPLQASRDWAKAAGFRMAEIKTGHDAMVTEPERLSDMLEAMSA
jgi:pimeloyl-ACP methyl ester carboxylesterase